MFNILCVISILIQLLQIFTFAKMSNDKKMGALYYCIGQTMLILPLLAIIISLGRSL